MAAMQAQSTEPRLRVIPSNYRSQQTDQGNIVISAGTVGGNVAVGGLADGLYYMVSTATTTEITEQTRIKALELRVDALERKLASIKQELVSDKWEDDAVTLRDVSREQAKMEIRQVFAISGVHYISEVAEFLHLPDELVVDLCAELMHEGELEVNDDVLRAGS